LAAVILPGIVTVVRKTELVTQQ